MIHPSYVDLMKVVNKDVEEGEEPVISSRYSVVMATAKRARQIIAGDEPMVKVKDKQKPLSIAVDEMNQETLRILTDEEKEAMYASLEEETQEEESTENE
ncbi:DNA-directed RNA polymerase subunit omega [Butyrivibrio proteoclasticus]|uniref:DNA-directed RNA polymerase subunit omega n=1 Tax=Butyrivibrio proteoclasticus TaxID=43305 RepID=UPI00047D04D4|nr:DNA-directed RNA polymerase subunit omega [Butyrivibrio proteoclasticus]